MLSKLRSMQRVAALYAVMVEARAYDLEVATMRLRATEMEIERRESFLAEAFNDGRLALKVENTLDWRVAEVTTLVAHRDIAALAERRLVEFDQFDIANAEYIQGKQRSEQLKRIVDEMRLQAVTAEARFEQARSDDRFLGRKHWLSLQRH